MDSLCRARFSRLVKRAAKIFAICALIAGCGSGSGSTLSPDTPPAATEQSFDARWQSVHVGLQLQGESIPKEGLPNATLERALGVAVEPYGAVTQSQDHAFVSGRVSHFGGPQDMGVGPTETGAITGEIVRNLNDPLSPDAATLASRPEDYYYVAMRFDYSQGGRTFWRDARILVMAVETERAVVLRPVDWGPHTRTGRIIDLSPQAISDLGIATDDFALVAFAAPGTELGKL